eukprot:4885897-Alexandrium_andersonii.AAC.1
MLRMVLWMRVRMSPNRPYGNPCANTTVNMCVKVASNLGGRNDNRIANIIANRPRSLRARSSEGVAKKLNPSRV